MRRFASIGCLLLACAPPAPGGAANPPPPRGPLESGAAAAAGEPGQDPALESITGAYTFRSSCAPCHGADGRGDGPLAENLRFHPPDLTLIARRHGGSFPSALVFRVVDGRKAVKGRGGTDMPVWGDAFKDADTGYDDRQVRQKIRQVVEYLRTLQAR